MEPAARRSTAGAVDPDTDTKRFRAKRDAILAAAAEAINEQSEKSMTFTSVTRRVGLKTTSVTYYLNARKTSRHVSSTRWSGCSRC